MAKFKWSDAFVWNHVKREYCYETLSRYINEYGIHTLDRYNCCVFMGIDSREIEDAKKIIDFIFEYKPDLLIISLGYIRYHDILRYYNFYILQKFLEQDMSYRYLRDPFKVFSCSKGYVMVAYPNFISFLPVYMQHPYGYQLYDQMFISMLKDHYYKYITFFELMKQKLLK